jgi:superfamily II DNA or RNA helicase
MAASLLPKSASSSVKYAPAIVRSAVDFRMPCGPSRIKQQSSFAPDWKVRATAEAVAAWLIAKRKVNTLIVVHRQQLLDQWQERLGMFLDLPPKSIGHIGGGKMDRTGCVDVAVIQSLYRKDEVKDFVAECGQVIVDECHHISAFTFEQVMSQAKAKYVVGLTATPTRKDGHHPIIYMTVRPGAVQHERSDDDRR